MKQLFINLPVKDLEKSMIFYTQLGFTNNPLFTDDHQKCMVWSEQIYLMLLTFEKFESYIKKPVAEIKKFSAAYYTLTVESLDKVNEIAESGLKAGGTEPITMIDHGFMQLRRIEDFDGHNWDVIFLDMSKFKKV